MQDVVNDPITLLQGVIHRQHASGHTFSGATINIAGIPSVPYACSARRTRSTRVSVWSSAFRAHTAPAPTAKLLGFPPTGKLASKREVRAEISATESEEALANTAEPP